MRDHDPGLTGLFGGPAISEPAVRFPAPSPGLSAPGEAGATPFNTAPFNTVARLKTYWEGLCASHEGLPPSSALDPDHLSPMLEDLFIAERVGRGLLRLRVAGRSLSALAGVDMQGLPLSALLMPDTRPEFAEIVETLFDSRKPVEIALQSGATLGRMPLRAQMLLLPLALPRLGPAVLLGCLTTEHSTPPQRGTRYAFTRSGAEREIPGTAPQMIIPPLTPARPAMRSLRLIVSQPWLTRSPRSSQARLRLVDQD